MISARKLVQSLTFFVVLASESAAEEKLYVGDRLGQVVMVIDVATGNRREVEMEDYPSILSARTPLPDSSETFLFASYDATLRPAIRRYHLPTGIDQGISGFTDTNSTTPQGTGPIAALGFTDWVLTHEGTLMALHEDSGPIEIDLGSGDRRLLASEISPVTGADPPLLEALDLVIESSRTVLIADRFQGIFRMDRNSGHLEIAYPSTSFVSSPYNIERLPDGRIVHCLTQGDANLYAFNPITGEDSLLSSGGPFPVGGGVPFVAVWDIAVDPTGKIYVYDLGIPAVFQVHAKTGDRTLISGEDRGEGAPLLSGFNQPVLSADFKEVATKAVSSWQLH